jgi:hypothetical protein
MILEHRTPNQLAGGVVAMTDPAQANGLDKGVRRHADKLLALSALMLLTIGTIAYRLFEDWSWVDSLYFCVVAVTTVGFGDLSPTSDGAKIFTVFYILSGVAIISVWLNERLRHHTKRVAKRIQQ